MAVINAAVLTDTVLTATTVTAAAPAVSVLFTAVLAAAVLSATVQNCHHASSWKGTLDFITTVVPNAAMPAYSMLLLWSGRQLYENKVWDKSACMLK